MEEKKQSADSAPRQTFVEGSNNSDEAILGLNTLNGLPIEVLEERMRPKGMGGAFVGYYSYDGFLGKDESLIEALLKANKIVRKNGYTHQILADWLDLAAASSQPPAGKYTFNEMEFEVSYGGTVSKGQESPLQNPELKDDSEAEGWDGEYWVKNLRTGRNFKFTPQIPRWARKYGFYEGFDTPYHVDPQLIIDTFTKTGRVFETKEEHAEHLKKDYMAAGWKEVVIGDPETVFSHFPQSYFDLVKYKRDDEGEDKIVQYLEDDNFIIAALGRYDPFNEFGLGIAIYDSKAPNSPLVVVQDPARYDIKRDNAVLDITVRGLGRSKDELAKIIVFNKPQNGWTVRQSGEAEFIGGFHYLFEYGTLTLDTSVDTFELYKNQQLDFMVQKRSGQPIFFYKKNKATGKKEIFLLTKDNLKDRLRIPDNYLSGDCIISEVKEVSTFEENIVRGKVIIDGQEVSFSL